MTQLKAIGWFTDSAAALLAAAGVALFISNGVGAGFLPLHDPVFGVPMPVLFWIVGTIFLGVGMICLSRCQAWLKLSLVLWFALNLCAYQIGLFCLSGPHSFNGYWGGLAAAFEISPLAVNVMLKILSLYLLTGSFVFLVRLRQRIPIFETSTGLRMSCPACGGHLAFPVENLGQSIGCPHCSGVVKLRKPDETLKMSCFFCEEHIEFPAHALGRKIKCPHCKMEVGLREQSV